jgi:hypothetical protein
MVLLPEFFASIRVIRGPLSIIPFHPTFGSRFFLVISREELFGRRPKTDPPRRVLPKIA